MDDLLISESSKISRTDEPPATRAAEAQSVAQPLPLYRVGTLVYTRRALVSVFLWMLWGNFCFTMMEMILPRLLPLQLQALGASNFAIGLLVGTIPSAMNFVIAPIVSFKSDRYRSRLGRRIPFLLWPTPFLTLFLVLLGYSAAAAEAMHGWGIPAALGLSPTTLALAWIGLLVIGFVFFNMFVASVYYYLFNDVVPPQFLGRFMALYGVVGTMAAFVFNRWIFGWAEHHMKEVYLGVSVLYLVAFMLMCWRVREGEYPPPPPSDPNSGIFSSIWSGVRTYFTECYSHPYYLWFFLGTAFWSVSQASAVFMVFFAKDIGLSVDDFGKVLGWQSLLAAIILYPIGTIVDRLHPLRMVLFGITTLIPFNLVFFFAVHGYNSFLIVSLLSLLPTAIFGAANLPMYMSILPRERYGQFCSAQAMVNAVLMIAGTALAGKFMDWMRNDYRYLYVWMLVFQVLAVVCLMFVYRGWRRYGGPNNYVPPQVDVTPAPGFVAISMEQGQTRSEG